jgi:transposase-like protein
MICPHCSATKTVKNGKRKTRWGYVQKYKCKVCRREFSVRNKTYCERVREYLRRYCGAEEPYPFEITGEGIAMALGANWGTISRVLSRMCRDGEVTSKTGRVRGSTRKRKVYLLRRCMEEGGGAATAQGMRS